MKRNPIGTRMRTALDIHLMCMGTIDKEGAEQA